MEALLLWLGMISGAITLTNSVAGWFRWSPGFLWLQTNWSALPQYV
jgi:hypothetical protein